MHVRFRNKQQWHTSHGSKSSKYSPKNNRFQGRKTSSALLHTEIKILNPIITLNNCIFVFDHPNSSLPTIFDLFKPFKEQHNHNTREARRYVLNILTKMKMWNGAISIIYKFYNCNCLKNKNYKIKSPFQFLSLWYIYKVIITFKLSFRSIFRLINKSEYKSEVYSDLYYFFLWPQLKIQIWKPKERERSCTLRF